jgi:hypothetical protein
MSSETMILKAEKRDELGTKAARRQRYQIQDPDRPGSIRSRCRVPDAELRAFTYAIGSFP